MSSTKKITFVEVIKNTFAFTVLLSILRFLETINLVSVFLSNGTNQPSKNQKKKSKKQKPKALFPAESNVDLKLKDSASVVPCSTSYNASYIPVKSDAGQINWDLTDNSSSEEIFKIEGKDVNNANNNNSSLDLPTFLTNSATCSTASGSSPMSHYNSDSEKLQTIPAYHFQNDGKGGARNSVISSDNDDTSLREIDLDQLTNFTDFCEFDVESKPQEIITQAASDQSQTQTPPQILTPELKQGSKSETNTPNKIAGTPESSVSSSPELDGVDYTFSKSILSGAEPTKLENDDDLDENEDDLDEDESKMKVNGGKKNSAKSHACPFCPAEFRIRGYLTRHIKKHAVQKAYTCPFFNPNAEHKCHPSGGFSRRDTYKTHLKARHFKHPAGTRSQDRSTVGGKCAICGTSFETNESWVENHIENGACPGLPVGYQCRSAGSRRKKNKSKFGVSNENGVVAMGVPGIGIQNIGGDAGYAENVKAFQYYEQQRQMQHLQQIQQQQIFGATDLMQRSISPLDGIYQQRIAQQQYVPQQPRHNNQIQQHMFEIQIQQAQQRAAFQQAQQAAAQAAQLTNQKKFIVEDEDFMTLADEYSPSYSAETNVAQTVSAGNVQNVYSAPVSNVSSASDQGTFGLDSDLLTQFSMGEMSINHDPQPQQQQPLQHQQQHSQSHQSNQNSIHYFENSASNFPIYQQNEY